MDFYKIESDLRDWPVTNVYARRGADAINQLRTTITEKDARIAQLEEAQEKLKDELFAVLIQDMSRDSAINKINEVIG